MVKLCHRKRWSCYHKWGCYQQVYVTNKLNKHKEGRLIYAFSYIFVFLQADIYVQFPEWRHGERWQKCSNTNSYNLENNGTIICINSYWGSVRSKREFVVVATAMRMHIRKWSWLQYWWERRWNEPAVFLPPDIQRFLCILIWLHRLPCSAGPTCPI